MRFFRLLIVFGGIGIAGAAGARVAVPRPRFKRAMIVILENIDFKDALAQPFLGRLAREGALLANYHALTHPSQPNYVALTAGTFEGVHRDDPASLDLRHIGDLLEAKGKAWKVYAQGYPGGCFLGAFSGRYARKHVPFLSFVDVQKNPAECARVVDASVLAEDIAKGTLPEYSLYVPDLDNDGHDTGVAYADRWLAKEFGPLLENPSFMKDMLFIVTFDEDDFEAEERRHVHRTEPSTNRIYTVLYGNSVAAGRVSKTHYDHYSLLRTIENAWGLGTLGRGDAKARPIAGVWK